MRMNCTRHVMKKKFKAKFKTKYVIVARRAKTKYQEGACQREGGGEREQQRSGTAIAKFENRLGRERGKQPRWHNSTGVRVSS